MHRDRKPVCDGYDIRNSGIDGEERGDKAVVLDILATDERGRLYNVESAF